MENFFEKIGKLIKKFREGGADSQDVSTLESWEGEAKRLFLLKSLKDHDGVKYLLGIFTSDVKKIDELLKTSYSKELPDKERDRLLDRKALAEKYLNLLVPVESELEQLEAKIDEELTENIS